MTDYIRQVMSLLLPACEKLHIDLDKERVSHRFIHPDYPEILLELKIGMPPIEELEWEAPKPPKLLEDK